MHAEYIRVHKTVKKYTIGIYIVSIIYVNFKHTFPEIVLKVLKLYLSSCHLSFLKKRGSRKREITNTPIEHFTKVSIFNCSRQLPQN